MGGATAFFFLEGDRYIAVGAQADGVSLDIRHKAQRNEVVMTPVAPLAAIILGQLYAVPVYPIDSANTRSVRTYDLRVFFDKTCIDHVQLLFC
jgi:hypothetical protein